MSTSAQPPLWHLLSSIGLLVVGCLFLWLHHFSTTQAITPHHELTLFDDVPLIKEVNRHKTGVTVVFHVKGKTIEYSSDDPNFHAIHEALLSHEKLQFGVSLKQETVFKRADIAALYEVKWRDGVLLDYATTVEHRLRSAESMLLIGGLIALTGFVGVVVFLWQRKHGADMLAPPWGGRFTAAIVLLFLLGFMSLTDQRDGLARNFGEAPFGIPVVHLAIGVVTTLYVPLFWLWPHLVRINRQARLDGYSSIWQGVEYLFHVSSIRPELRRSQRLALFGLFYLLLLVCAVAIATMSN